MITKLLPSELISITPFQLENAWEKDPIVEVSQEKRITPLSKGRFCKFKQTHDGVGWSSIVPFSPATEMSVA